jgi:hypothetical protein
LVGSVGDREEERWWWDMCEQGVDEDNRESRAQVKAKTPEVVDDAFKRR